jgi:hypothetical protein
VEFPPPPPPQPGPDPASRGRTPLRILAAAGMLILSLAIAAAVVLLVVAIVKPPAANPRTMRLSSGSVVYSDQFTSARSGWPRATLASGTTVGYGGGDGGRYFIAGQGPYSHYVAPQYATPLQAMAITVTAVVAQGDARSSGYGIRCNRAVDGQPSYAFFVDPIGTLLVDRYSGTTSAPVLLDRGFGPRVAGVGGRTTITGACILVSAGGGKATVRLVLAVGNAIVADIVDSAPGTGDGWTAALVTSTTTAQPSTVDFTSFSIRNLDG